MNWWTEIKEKYPKAYDKYIDWCHAEDCPSSKCYQHTGKDPYDFFDSNNIFIVITYNLGGKNWGYYSDYSEPFVGGFNSRTEAEEKAFEKGFEILEDKL